MEKKSTSPVRIEILQKHHDRTRFDCGTESLNQYLKQLAKQEQQRRTAAVFVLVREDAPQVLGYYTLSQSSVLLSELPASRHKKLPRYPQVPTTLLGRLAVDQSCRGMRYGELLLMNALERAWTASQQVASFAMIVDVLEVEPDPMLFYLRYDFEALPTQPRRQRKWPNTCPLPMTGCTKKKGRLLSAGTTLTTATCPDLCPISAGYCWPSFLPRPINRLPRKRPGKKRAGELILMTRWLLRLFRKASNWPTSKPAGSKTFPQTD